MFKPRKPEPMSKGYPLRLTEDEHIALSDAAERVGLSLNDYIRKAIGEAIDRQLEAAE